MATITLTNNLTTGNLTVDASDTLVTDGYDIVVTGNMVINGTLNATAGTGGATLISVAGNWALGSAGVFTYGTSIVTFNGAADTTQTIAMNNDGTQQKFNDVVFQGGGTTVYQVTSTTSTSVPLNVAGTTTLNEGILDFNNKNVKLESNLVVEVSGTGPTRIDSGTGTVTVMGDVNFTGLNTFNHENGKWVFAEIGTVGANKQLITSAGHAFYTVEFDGSNGGGTITYEMQDAFVANNTTELKQGTLDFNNQTITFDGNFTVSGVTSTAIASGSGTVTAKGNVNFSTLDTFNHESGKWVFAKVSGTQAITNNGATFYNVDFNGAAATAVVYQMQDAFVTAAGSAINLHQGKIDFNDKNATIGGSITTGVAASTEILSGTGTITVTGNADFATLDALAGETGTWKFVGSSQAITMAASNLSFSNVTFDGTSFTVTGASMVTSTLGAVVLTSGTLTVNDINANIATFSAAAGTLNSGSGMITATGNVNFTNLTTFVHEGGTWKFTMAAGASIVYTERRPDGDLDKGWWSVASSADGSHLIAGSVDTGGRIYTSSDYGANWTERRPSGDEDRYWAVGSDADGSHLIASYHSNGGRLYTSSDYGANWTERQPDGDVDKDWVNVASDSDGSHLFAAAWDNRLYTSSDGGANWTERRPAGDFDKGWYKIASDDDGSHLVAAVYEGRLYTSSDYGANWTERRPAGDFNKGWSAVASDADGSHLIAGVEGGRLYVSSDSGANWTERRPSGDENKYWHGVASDADGSHLVAAVGNGRLYTSSDSGANWTERQPAGDENKIWKSVASDADGSHLIAGVAGGRLYTIVSDSTQRLTSAGKTFNNVTFDGSDSCVIQDALVAVGGLSVVDGALDFNDKNVTVTGNFVTTGGDLSSGSGAVKVAGNVDFTGLTTFTHESGAWELNGTAAQSADFDGETLNNFKISNASNDVTLVKGFATVGTNEIVPNTFVKFGSGETFTFANLSWNGGVGNFITLRATTFGVQWNLTTDSTETVSFIDVEDSNSTAFQIDATNNGVNAGNNVNWLFGVQVRYWIGTGGNWSSEANWSATSGGVGGVSVPANSDTVILDDNSGDCDLDMDVRDATRIGIFNCTDYASTFTGTGFDMEICGDVTLVVGMTFVAPDLTVFHKHSSAMYITSAGKLFKAVYFGNDVEVVPEGLDEEWVLVDALSTGTDGVHAVTLNYGTLNLNAKTLTCGGFSIDNSTTHTAAIDRGNSSIIESYGNFDLRGLDEILGSDLLVEMNGTTGDVYTAGFRIDMLKVSGGTINLRDAILLADGGWSTGQGTLEISSGTLNTNNFGITCSLLLITGTFNMGSSIVTLDTGLKPVNGIIEIDSSGVVNAGTSTVVIKHTSTGSYMTDLAGVSWYNFTIHNVNGSSTFGTENQIDEQAPFTVTNELLLKRGTLSIDHDAILKNVSADDTGETTLVCEHHYEPTVGVVTVTGNVNLTNLDTFTPKQGTWKFTATSGEQQLTSVGHSFYNVTVEVSVGAKVVLQDAFTSTNSLIVTSGELDLASVVVNLGQLSFGTVGDTTLTCGSSTVTLTSHLNFTNLDVLTIGTSRFVFAATGGTQMVTSASKSFNYVTFDATGADVQLQDAMNALGYGEGTHDDVLVSAGQLALNDKVFRVGGSLKATGGSVGSGIGKTGKIVMVDSGNTGERIHATINVGHLQIGEA